MKKIISALVALYPFLLHAVSPASYDRLLDMYIARYPASLKPQTQKDNKFKIIHSENFARDFYNSNPTLEQIISYSNTILSFPLLHVKDGEKVQFIPESGATIFSQSSPFDYVISGSFDKAQALVIHNTKNKKTFFANITLGIDTNNGLASLIKKLSDDQHNFSDPEYINNYKITILSNENDDDFAQKFYAKAEIARTLKALFLIGFEGKQINIVYQNLNDKLQNKDVVPHVYLKNHPTSPDFIAIDKNGNLYNACILQSNAIKFNSFKFEYNSINDAVDYLNLCSMKYDGYSCIRLNRVGNEFKYTDLLHDEDKTFESNGSYIEGNNNSPAVKNFLLNKLLIKNAEKYLCVNYNLTLSEIHLLTLGTLPLKLVPENETWDVNKLK